MITVKCVFCGEKVELQDDLKVTQVVECPQCHGLMEVVWLFPLDLMPYEAAEGRITPPTKDGQQVGS